MQIAVIVPSLRDQAPVQVAVAIAVQLTRMGHEVIVFHLGAERELPQVEEIIFEKLSFWGYFDWKRFDIIHSHGFLPDAFVSIRKPLRGNARTVSTVHNYVFVELRMLYSRIISWIIGLAWLLVWSRMDHLVVLTEDALHYYESFYKRKKLTRIYNGRDITPDPAVIPAEQKQLMEKMRSQFAYSIGSYSALISRKRIDILVRHVSRAETGCLFILGEGPEQKELEDLVAHHHLQPRVKFFGHVPQAHQYNFEFDLFVHPSASEGFSLSMIEAALHKKKIVCSDIPSFTEAFNDTEVTFFDRRNELTIDQAIQNALRDDVKAMNAYMKAKSLYSEEQMAKEYEKLFAQLLEADQ